MRIRPDDWETMKSVRTDTDILMGVTIMSYCVKQIKQGLLGVYHNDKRTEWKISNEGGKWILYRVQNNEVEKHPFDFAPMIHHLDGLAEKLEEIIG